MSAVLHDWIAELAQINSDPDAGGITREVYTPEYTRAVTFVSELMVQSGLTVRIDAVGNLFGRWEGSAPELPRVLTGSHFDTTLNAGRLDGVLGVLGAIDALRQLRAAGVEPRRSIEIIGFAGEEPRFGAGCIGSRAMVGTLTCEDLDRMRDRTGTSVAEAMRDSGFDPDRLEDALLDPREVHAQVELHIEQGSVLEHRGAPLGIVERIAAPHDHRLVLRGLARHSGSTPMELRCDALTGAAEIVLTVERLARESRSHSTVGTVGVLEVRPGAVNVIPGEVVIDIDIRDSDLATRDEVVAAMLAKARQVADERGLTLSVETTVQDNPAICDPIVVAAVRAACEAAGIPGFGMTSGAYHDSMVLGAKVPIGMIFVPSIGGISHHPDEDTAPEDLDRGVAVLAATLSRLAE